MKSVGDECRRTDPATRTEAVLRRDLVARESQPGRQRNQPEIADIDPVHQALDRFVRGEHRRRGDGENDRDAGDVLGAAVAVGIPLVGLAG
jgi:hypothetical protein